MSFQLVICANLAEVLKSAGLTSLLDAADSVGLGDTLNTEGPFTIFAPTNKAFKKLPDGWDEDRGIQEKYIYSSNNLHFLSDSDALKILLSYHILSGIVKSSDAANNAGLTSLDGGTIRMNVYLRLRQTKTMPSVASFFMPLIFQE
jgi:transforming growth factor-beta-induced protein